MEELDKARAEMGHSNVLDFVHVAIQSAVKGATRTRQGRELAELMQRKENEKARLRSHWASEMERARRAGFDLPEGLFS